MVSVLSVPVFSRHLTKPTSRGAGWPPIPHRSRGSLGIGHATIGLILLLFANIRAFRGHFSPEEHRGVEVPGIYWHFVDIMWIVVYTTVYIL